MRVVGLGFLAKEQKKGEKVPEFYSIPIEGWKYKYVNVKPNFGKVGEQHFEIVIQKMVLVLMGYG